MTIKDDLDEALFSMQASARSAFKTLFLLEIFMRLTIWTRKSVIMVCERLKQPCAR